MATKSTAEQKSLDNADLPVVIAGGGCVGLFLALLLAQSDIKHRVVVSKPRKMNYDFF
jgi:2-polyprenyl-6-methoxyphenol hydroxylase-like FAD-dependent oxidoreductase